METNGVFTGELQSEIVSQLCSHFGVLGNKRIFHHSAEDASLLCFLV